MTRRRIFISKEEFLSAFDAALGTLALPKEAAHRLRDVLRAKEGDEIEAFDGEGQVIVGLYHAEKSPLLKQAKLQKVQDGRMPLILVQALVKMDKLEQVTQRATEIGASELWIFRAAHSNVDFKEKAQDRMQRLVRIAQDAARQSERVSVPVLKGILSFDEMTKEIQKLPGFLCMGDARTDLSLVQLLETDRAWQKEGFAIVIGPEGGLSEEELKSLEQAGAQAVRYNPYVLRTETAGLAALAIVQAMA